MLVQARLWRDFMSEIRWRIHLRTSPEVVFRALTTAQGRARFWAESAEAHEDVIHFRFSNGQQLESRVLGVSPPTRFHLSYFGNSLVTFELAPDGRRGTDLTLTEADVPPETLEENRAGWVSVLLSLKAAVDFEIDLRNHDPERTWERGYVDV